jgi:hypothetical protein
MMAGLHEIRARHAEKRYDLKALAEEVSIAHMSRTGER